MPRSSARRASSSKAIIFRHAAGTADAPAVAWAHATRNGPHTAVACTMFGSGTPPAPARAKSATARLTRASRRAGAVRVAAASAAWAAGWAK
jgi:hypothetical protein